MDGNCFSLTGIFVKRAQKDATAQPQPIPTHNMKPRKALYLLVLPLFLIEIANSFLWGPIRCNQIQSAFRLSQKNLPFPTKARYRTSHLSTSAEPEEPDNVGMSETEIEDIIESDRPPELAVLKEVR